MKQKSIWIFITAGITIAAACCWNNSLAQQRDSTTLFTNVKGLSIAYTRSGNGPALVLLHGLTQDSRVWRAQLDSLSKNFTVIAWDAPGAGLSADPPENFGITDWADCLAGLLDSAGIKRAHILGISWGGVLAQEFYQRHPQYVMTLLLAGTSAGWKGSFGDSIAKARLEAYMEDASLPPAAVVPKLLTGMFSDSAPQSAKEELANIIAVFHPSGFQLMAKAIASADTRDLLSKIKVPTLLIWGDSDKRSLLNIAHQLNAQIPGSKLEIISKAGHISNMENPTAFNKVVLNFCLQHSEK